MNDSIARINDTKQQDTNKKRKRPSRSTNRNTNIPHAPIQNNNDDTKSENNEDPQTSADGKMKKPATAIDNNKTKNRFQQLHSKSKQKSIAERRRNQTYYATRSPAQKAVNALNAKNRNAAIAATRKRPSWKKTRLLHQNADRNKRRVHETPEQTHKRSKLRISKKEILCKSNA